MDATINSLQYTTIYLWSLLDKTVLIQIPSKLLIRPTKHPSIRVEMREHRLVHARLLVIVVHYIHIFVVERYEL